MAVKAKKPIGLATTSPIVAETSVVREFIWRFVQREASLTDLAETLGLSYEVTKRVMELDAPYTSLHTADLVVMALADIGCLDRDIPLYRNPNMSEKTYLKYMRGPGEVDGQVIEGCDDEYSLSLPLPS